MVAENCHQHHLARSLLGEMVVVTVVVAGAVGGGADDGRCHCHWCWPRPSSLLTVLVAIIVTAWSSVLGLE